MLDFQVKIMEIKILMTVQRLGCCWRTEEPCFDPGRYENFSSFPKAFKQSLGPPFSCSLGPGAVSQERGVQIVMLTTHWYIVMR